MLHILNKFSGPIFYLFAALVSIKPDLLGGLLEATLAVCVAQLVRFAVSRKQTGLRTVLMIAGVFLFILPSIALAAFRNVDLIQYVVLYFLSSDIFRYLAERYDRSGPPPISNIASLKWRSDMFVLIVLLFWSCVSGFFVGEGLLTGLLTFTAPLAISLVYFERLIVGRVTRQSIFFLLGLYFLTVVVYILFHWSGFGRLLIGSFLLMPFLVVNRYHDLGFRGWQIILMAPLLLYLAQISRYGSVSSLERLFTGSAGHHLIVTKDAASFSAYMRSVNWGEFWNQFSLIYFNWVPRDLWPGKPLGAGWLSVGEMYGRQGFDDGYSQSLGFMGEQIYLLGPYAAISLTFVLSSLLLTRIAIRAVSDGYWAPVAIFDVGLISYFWGGGALFGSRVWFFLIPCLAVILVRKAFVRRTSLPLNSPARSAM